MNPNCICELVVWLVLISCSFCLNTSQYVATVLNVHFILYFCVHGQACLCIHGHMYANGFLIWVFYFLCPESMSCFAHTLNLSIKWLVQVLLYFVKTDSACVRSFNLIWTDLGWKMILRS
jgi:hypothetical protein